MLVEIEIKNPIKDDYTAKVYVPADKLKEITEIQRIYQHLLGTKPLWDQE